MCGIVGIAGPAARQLGEAWLAQAVGGLQHRGPDAHGIATEDGALLGHTRLAIVDLTPAGAQPMVSASGDSVLVYNGEVYNTAALRRPLGGLALRGHSDTEVLLERLEREGPGCLQEANGMFALAFWRRRTRTLTLARDRVGIKPLYVAELPGALAFCSELKPLLALPGVDRSLDREALQLYLTLGFVPAPWTLARGVRQMLPGEVWTIDDAARITRSRLAPPIGEPSTQPPLAGPAALAALGTLLQTCVADQLVADVPIGVLLSGGVDSSVVAAAAARAVGKIRTFAVVHRDPRYDERDAARAVANHLGSEHTEIELPAAGLTDAEFDALIDHHGDPFADSSSLPTRRLAHEVRRHVTVALSGDGGDELFAGYPRYLQNQQVELAARLPSVLRHGAGQLAARATALIPDERLRLRPRQVARALQLAGRPLTHRAVGTLTFFWPDEQQALLQPAVRHHHDVLAQLIAARAPAHLDLRTADGCHRLEQRLVLPDDMLVKVDRMTMAESLEVRPPLLDDRMVAFAAALPIELKIRRGEGKAILKDLARQWVPRWVIDRPKRGFALPLLDFGGQVLADRTAWALQSADSPLRQIFTPAALAQLHAEFTRRGEGIAPEDSPFRRAHRQWAVVVLATALQRHGITP